jgi:hypothetical protein
VRELVFALRFEGQAGPVAGSATLREASTAAPSQSLWTVIGADGVTAGVEPVAGERAVLESRVERFADGSFVEDGTITYGSAGRITFATVGRGSIGPSPEPGWQHGAVIWTVTAADGRFAGARGLITSNFLVGPGGAVVDHHLARLYLP